eukprot:5547172-Pyramimonas_sp.AAC.2
MSARYCMRVAGSVSCPSVTVPLANGVPAPVVSWRSLLEIPVCASSLLSTVPSVSPSSICDRSLFPEPAGPESEVVSSCMGSP